MLISIPVPVLQRQIPSFGRGGLARSGLSWAGSTAACPKWEDCGWASCQESSNPLASWERRGPVWRFRAVSETLTEVWRRKDWGKSFPAMLLLYRAFSYPFSACTHPAPTKDMHTSTVFWCLQPVASHDFLQGNPFGTVFRTAQVTPFSKIHLSLPTNELPTQIMCVTCRSARFQTMGSCCLSRTLARQCGHWRCRQEMHLVNLLMTELHCRLFSHTYTAPFAPLLSDHSCRRQRLDPECLVHSSDISLHYQKPLIVFNIPLEVCCDPSGMHCLPKLLME